jgi:hypothetical protein
MVGDKHDKHIRDQITVNNHPAAIGSAEEFVHPATKDMAGAVAHLTSLFDRLANFAVAPPPVCAMVVIGLSATGGTVCCLVW